MKTMIGLGLLLFLLVGNLYGSDTVIFNTQNQLVIPSIAVGDKMYAVSLNLIDNSNPLQFQLVDPLHGEVLSNSPSAVFSNLLTINQVMVGNDLYSATLQLVSGNPIIFELQEAALVCQDCAIGQGIDGSNSLFSTAFVSKADIPVLYTCSGTDISPALTWTPGPAGTMSYTIIMDDPDAVGYTWVHMNLYNIPATVYTLGQGLTNSNLPGTAAFGPNDSDNKGYDGPCPPRGIGYHHYFWRVYALDRVIAMPSSAMTRTEFESTYADNILDSSYLLEGIFAR